MIKELVVAIVKSSLLLQKIGMWVTIPETNIFAPENGWLGDAPFLFGFRPRPIFCGKLLGLGRGTHHTDSLAYSMRLHVTIHHTLPGCTTKKHNVSAGRKTPFSNQRPTHWCLLLTGFLLCPIFRRGWFHFEGTFCWRSFDLSASN